MDYFELFGLPHHFEVNIAALNTAYFKLQQEYHPDKNIDFAEKSALINNAYKTLKNRLKRAEYMAGNNLAACPALLLEIMELRENINIAEITRQIEELYKEFSVANNTKKKEIFVRIKYLSKIIEDNATI